MKIKPTIALLSLALLLAPAPVVAQVFGVQQSPTVSSTVYIDPTGSNGSGTCLSPFNTWTGHSLTGNVAFLQKAGTTWTAPSSSSPVLQTSGAGTGVYTPLILGTYNPVTCARITGVQCATLGGGSPASNGQCAIIDANANVRGIEVGHSFITIDNMEIKNTSDGPCIYNDSDPSNNMVVKNNFLHNCRDVSSGQGAGVFSFDDNSQIVNNIIDTVGDDALFLEGANLIVTGNILSNISVDAADGDGIQISDDAHVANSSNSYVAFNQIDHSTVDAKQCIIANLAQSTGGQFIFNTCIEKTGATVGACYSIGSPNMLLAGNTCTGGGWRLVDVLAQSNNAVVVGNVLTTSNVGANVKGIANNGATGLIVANNVFVNTTGTFTNQTDGIVGAGGTSIATNNIVQGWKNGVSGSGVTTSFSDFFGNQTNGTIGTGSIITDPLFIGGGNYNLQAGSGAKGTGTNPGLPAVITPVYRKVMASPFDMGAYWASSP